VRLPRHALGRWVRGRAEGSVRAGELWRSAPVAQDGVRVVPAVPATVPYQDLVSGATTGSRATVTVRERP